MEGMEGMGEAEAMEAGVIEVTVVEKVVTITLIIKGNIVAQIICQ